jgi:SAM-dependent methyltransferase
MKYYFKDVKNIGFFQKSATPSYWDQHWEHNNLREYILSCTSDSYFIPLTVKYLKTGSTILEGGCGRGQLVNALAHNGYRAIGIDFSQKTVKAINKAVPHLDIRFGDVRKLDIGSETLDGYISVGVIEHFWNGYDPIIEEAVRTLKKRGYLFLSFPYMSPLRKFKTFIRAYPIKFSYNFNERNFYQFALNHKRVLHYLESRGFSYIEKLHYDGIKGFKDELPFFRSYLQNVYDGKKHQRLRKYIDKTFLPLASHCILLVMQKR